MTTTPEQLASSCDDYLAARTATYEQRCDRYEAAAYAMALHGELTDDDILLDVGAGSTDFDHYLRARCNWRGRYWPMDGWMGVDLSRWAPQRDVSWVVMLEFIEHIDYLDASQLMYAAKGWCTKGIVLTTPNAQAVDTFAMDSTHRWGASAEMIRNLGFDVRVLSLYGQPNDSILGMWTP